MGTRNSYSVEVYIILHQINKLIETEIISVTTREYQGKEDNGGLEKEKIDVTMPSKNIEADKYNANKLILSTKGTETESATEIA